MRRRKGEHRRPHVVLAATLVLIACQRAPSEPKSLEVGRPPFELQSRSSELPSKRAEALLAYRQNPSLETSKALAAAFFPEISASEARSSLPASPPRLTLSERGESGFDL